MLYISLQNAQKYIGPVMFTLCNLVFARNALHAVDVHTQIIFYLQFKGYFVYSKIARPQESQLKVEFLGMPYNQTFDFVTGLFVKILTPACS